MNRPHPQHPWVARVQHDLVKRLLWVARDCRDVARQPMNGELIATLFDEEGKPIEAASLWERLQQEAPSSLEFAAFGVAIEACVEAARNDDLAGVLELEPAFERLREVVASSLKEPGSAGTPNRKDR